MKRFALTLAAVGSLALFAASPASASGRHGLGLYNQHNRVHDDLAHRSYHRDLTHSQAHRGWISYRQHERVHDSLDHEEYHDRVDHGRIHRSYRPTWRSYRQSGFHVSPYGVGYSTRGFVIRFRR